MPVSLLIKKVAGLALVGSYYDRETPAAITTRKLLKNGLLLTEPGNFMAHLGTSVGLWGESIESVGLGLCFLLGLSMGA